MAAPVDGVSACATGAADDGVAERNTRSVRRSAVALNATMVIANLGFEVVKFGLKDCRSFGFSSQCLTETRC